MAWQTPKTDWVSTDYLNASDVNRIVANQSYLADMAAKLFRTIELLPVDTKNYLSMIYAEEFNNIENNLAELYEKTYSMEIDTVEFVANGRTLDYEELNRIESLTANLNIMIEAQFALVPKFQFGLNQQFIKAKLV